MALLYFARSTRKIYFIVLLFLSHGDLDRLHGEFQERKIYSYLYRRLKNSEGITNILHTVPGTPCAQLYSTKETYERVKSAPK